VKKKRSSDSNPLNHCDQDGRSTLINATIANAPAIVQMLVDAKASLNVQDNNGQSALMHAAKMGYVEVGTMLLSARADVNMKDKQDHTALALSRSTKLSAALAGASKMEGTDESEELNELRAGTEQKAKFASDCYTEGQQHLMLALTSTSKKTILNSIEEAIQYMSLAQEYEPMDPELRASLLLAKNFRRQIGVIMTGYDSMGVQSGGRNASEGKNHPGQANPRSPYQQQRVSTENIVRQQEKKGKSQHLPKLP